VGAWRRAEKDGRTYGLSEKAWRVCESFKVLWRKAHPNVERLWYELEDAFKAAMQNKTEVFKVGKHLSVSAKRGWIRVHLPSGTAISYASCKIKTLQRSAVCAAFNQNGITYYGQNSKNKKWGRVLTYSGKLFENVCQKAARDIMAHNMLNAEAQGYDLLLTVHDELVAEADATSPPKKELSAILATNPPWSTDLPLAASGHVADRYGK
jgi:DNA polymerase